MVDEAIGDKIQQTRSLVDIRAAAHAAHDTIEKTCDNVMICVPVRNHVRLGEKNASLCQVKKVTASANNGSSKVLAVTETDVSADPTKTARTTVAESSAVGLAMVFVLLRKAAHHLSRRLEKVILKSAVVLQCTETNSGILADRCRVCLHHLRGRCHRRIHGTGRESYALGAVMGVRERMIDERIREMEGRGDVPAEMMA